MEKLLRAKEIAEILGVPVGTIRAWVFEKRLPFVHLGRAIRFRSEDIEVIRQKGIPKDKV